MHDVFVSYKRADLDKVKEIDRQLEALGVSCFIDARNIPAGSDWNQTIEDEIRASKAVLVVWSEAAVRRERGKVSYVVAEATKGLEFDKLVATSLSEPLDLPAPFNLIQAPNIARFLEDQEQHAADPNWDRVLKDLGAKIERPGLHELAALRNAPNDLGRARSFVKRFADDPKADAVWADIEHNERKNFEARWNAAKSQLTSRGRKAETRLRKCQADFEAWLGRSRNGASAAAPDPSKYVDADAGLDRVAELEEIAAEASRTLAKSEALRDASSAEADRLRREAEAASQALRQAVDEQRKSRRNKLLMAIVGALAGIVFALAAIYYPLSTGIAERDAIKAKLGQAEGRITGLTQDLDRQTGLANDRQASLDTVRAQLSNLASDRDGLVATITDLRAKLDQAGKDIAAVTAAKDELVAKSKLLQEEIDRMPATTKEFQAKIDALTLQLADAQKAAETAAAAAKSHIDQLGDDLAKARKAAEDAGGAARTQIDELRAELGKARKAAEDAAVAAKARIDDLAQARKNAEEAAALAKAQSAQLTAQLAQATFELTRLRKLGDEAASIANAKIVSLTADVNQARKSAEDAGASLRMVAEYAEADQACTEKSGGRYDLDNLSGVWILNTDTLDVDDLSKAAQACRKALENNKLPKWDRRRLNAQLGRLSASLALKTPATAQGYMNTALGALKLADDDESAFAWQLLGGYWNGRVGTPPDPQNKSDNLTSAYTYYKKAASQHNSFAIAQLALLWLSKDFSASVPLDEKRQEAQRLIDLVKVLGYAPADVYQARLDMSQVPGGGPTPASVLSTVIAACSSSDQEVQRSVKFLLDSFNIRDPGGKRRTSC